MRYHDFLLKKYEVSEEGKRVILHLIKKQADRLADTSVITFTDVALYHFVHTSSAIITDLEEQPVSDFLPELRSQLTEWHRLNSIRLWTDNYENYTLHLVQAGYKAWRIGSAIGLSGFVIAKGMSNIQQIKPSKLRMSH